MKKKSFTELSNSVKELVSTGSVFKGSIFRSTLRAEDVSDRAVKEYLSSVLNFVTEWNDYSNEINDVLKDSKTPNKSWVTVDYDDVKNFLYSNYDYASVLPFVDGLFRGLDDGKFEDEDDVEDFFDHTTERAFKQRASTTAGLLEDVSDIGGGSDGHTATDGDIAKFKSVRTQELFKRTDNRDLYKSIEKVAQFLQTQLNQDWGLIQRSPKLLISIINYTVEYMSYSLVAYGTRIYAIGEYVYPFANSSAKMESVEASDSLETGVGQTLNDELFRDISNFDKVKEIMDEWLKKLGIKKEEDKYSSSGMKENNVFYQKTLSNELREYLVGPLPSILTLTYNQRGFEQLRDSLNKYTHNTLQGIQGTSTPKQEMMAVIKSTMPEHKTVDSYKDLAEDLVEYTIPLMKILSMTYDDIQAWRIREANSPSYTNSVLKITNEIMNDIVELYREISNAMLTKARDIEMTIASIKNETTKKRMEELTIKIPGEKKDDLSSNDNTMMGVPDTTRTPLDMTALYALPKMESLEMYDEYVRSLPEMQGDPYYEAIDLSSIINAIVSFFSSMVKRFQNFFTNTQFKLAVKWCEDHKERLQQMDFSGSEIEVLPYKKDTNLRFLENLSSRLNEFNENTFKTKENLNKFISSLYNNGDQGLINLVNNEKLEQGEKAQRFQNYILFDIDLSSEGQPATKKLHSAREISDELNNVWMDNVTKSLDTYKAITDQLNKINGSVSNIKSKITSATSQANNETTPPAMGNNDQQSGNTNANNTAPNTATTAGTNANAAQQTNTNQPNQAASGNVNNSDLATEALTRTQAAINFLWNGAYNAVTSSIKTQYHYIQQAWTIGSNNGKK